MSTSNYARNAFLDWTVGRTGTITAPSPATRYIRCWTTMPDRDGAGGVEAPTESRKQIVVATHFNTAASAGSISNDGDITWSAATQNWGTILGITIEDAASAGNLLRLITLTSGVVVNDTQIFEIPLGNLTLSYT